VCFKKLCNPPSDNRELWVPLMKYNNTSKYSLTFMVDSFGMQKLKGEQ